MGTLTRSRLLKGMVSTSVCKDSAAGGIAERAINAQG